MSHVEKATLQRDANQLGISVQALLERRALGKADAVGWLPGIGPWLVPTQIGASGALLISVGASFSLFPLALQSVVQHGYNTVYGPVPRRELRARRDEVSASPSLF